MPDGSGFLSGGVQLLQTRTRELEQPRAFELRELPLLNRFTKMLNLEAIHFRAYRTWDQSLCIEHGGRTVLESEQIGIDVMGDLRQQREVITRSRENMGKAGWVRQHVLKHKQPALEPLMPFKGNPKRLFAHVCQFSREFKSFSPPQVGQNYGMAGKMLDGMLQRADQNRRMVCMIAGLFLFMLVFAFYFLASG